MFITDFDRNFAVGLSEVKHGLNVLSLLFVRVLKRVSGPSSSQFQCLCDPLSLQVCGLSTAERIN